MTDSLHFTLISPFLVGQQQNEIEASLQPGSEVPEKTMGYRGAPEGDADVSFDL